MRPVDFVLLHVNGCLACSFGGGKDEKEDQLRSLAVLWDGRRAPGVPPSPNGKYTLVGLPRAFKVDCFEETT